MEYIYFIEYIYFCIGWLSYSTLKLNNIYVTVSYTKWEERYIHSLTITIGDTDYWYWKPFAHKNKKIELYLNSFQLGIRFLYYIIYV